MALQWVINYWYSSVAGSFYDRRMEREAESRGILFQNLAIQADEKVLEIAAGTGLNFRYYPENAKYTALDINLKMLQKQKERITRYGRTDITCQQANARQLPFPNDSYDVAILTYALSAIPRNKRALKETVRVVRPGGRIGVLDFTKASGRQLGAGGFAGHDLARIIRKQKGVRITAQMPGRTARDNMSDMVYVLEVL